MRLVPVLGVLAALFLAGGAQAAPIASLIHFTETGRADSAPLAPGFRLASSWSALGKAADGRIFIAVSNHDEAQGDAAIFALDPKTDRMRFIDTIRAASERAGNWRAEESQYKVHTFLSQHADGGLYFASSPSDDPSGSRGAHLYRLDPETDSIEDLSATAPFRIAADLTVAANSGPDAGVVIPARGIKGLALNPAAPDRLYLMTYPDGGLYRHSLGDGGFERIGQSDSVSYAFHVDESGDVYYLGAGASAGAQSLLRYDAATGRTESLLDGVAADEVIGMIAPWRDGRRLSVLLAASKRLLTVDTVAEQAAAGGRVCGQNWWRLFNMAASPLDDSLYFVSNNNNRSEILRSDADGGGCESVLDVDDLLGSRNLAFGGVNIWSDDSFYTPVWTFQGDDDLALLKVDLGVIPAPLPSPGALLLGALLWQALRRRSARLC